MQYSISQLPQEGCDRDKEVLCDQGHRMQMGHTVWLGDVFIVQPGGNRALGTSPGKKP